jgi:hypothetical protein
MQVPAAAAQANDLAGQARALPPAEKLMRPEKNSTGMRDWHRTRNSGPQFFSLVDFQDFRCAHVADTGFFSLENVT